MNAFYPCHRCQRFAPFAALVFAISLFFPSGLNAQQAAAKQAASSVADSRMSAKAIADSLTSTRRLQQTALSPDAVHVAWVQPIGGPAGKHGIYVASINEAAASAQPMRITAPRCKGCNEESIAWSPDGSHIAFLSDAAAAGQMQLYIADRTGKAVRQLTRLTGYLADPKWSRDGKRLAILFTENAPRTAGPLAPMTPPSGVIDSKVYEQRLTTVDLASGQAQQLSPAEIYVYEYDWSPDGNNFALIAAPGSGDANWYIAQIYTLPTAGGTMKSIFKPDDQMQIAIPRWSPDGSSLAFIGGIMSDEGSTGGDIYTVAVSGGVPRDVTPGISASPTWLEWTKPEEILFAEDIDGQAGLATVNLRATNPSEAITTLWKGPDSITMGGEIEVMSASLARSARSAGPGPMNAAVIRQSFVHPPEVWAGPIGSWKQITHLNDNLRPMWGEAKSVHWTSDGNTVQGWLLLPRNYHPSRKYPMVVVVHGGPASAVSSSWPRAFLGTAALAVNGYFVFMPNPRGSYGQGEKFTQGNIKDFGYGDLRDIMSGMDKVISDFPIDGNRIGITGWSYGGFMTMWAITQTNRFRAAVAGAGLSNWQSYYGENDIDLWMIPYFGASVYDDPAVYAKSSPINFVKRVKTPTLVLVGDRDGEVPAPQSFEYWHALKTLGVETQLVVYPNEGHRISQPEHVEDIITRLLGWFDTHMPAGAAGK